MDTAELLARLGSKKKGKKQKNKSRKLGRNHRWAGIEHSLTKYRGEGHRERNKASKAAARARRMGHEK